MSKVSSYICPRCGAPLPHATPGTSFCEFCGSPIKVTPESLAEIEPRKFGYEFEKGRYDAQNSVPGAALAEEIQKLIQPLDDLHQTESSYADLKWKTANAKSKLEKAGGYNKILMYTLPLLAFLYLLFVRVPVLAALAVAIGFFAVYRIHFRAREKALRAAYAKSKKQLASIRNHLNELKDNYQFDLVPEDYREREAMAYFVKVLRNGRAASLQQAINLYEDEKHKKQVLRLQQEQLALKQEALDVQRQQMEADQAYKEKQLELAQQKKSVDWGAVAAVAGTVVAAAIAFKDRQD